MSIELIFSPARRLQCVLEFEAALARALVRARVAPEGSDDAIAAACDVTRFDLAAIGRAAVDAGNEAIPIVERLRAIVAERSNDAATFVHWGATSQDAIDTALALQLRAARKLIAADLTRLTEILATIAHDHAATPIVGRTWLQHAPPTTFGLKAAMWLDAIERHAGRFDALWERVLVIQLGGSVGTLAVLGAAAPAVADALADDLALGRPSLPWHTTRDRVAEVATTCGLLVGTLGKIAKDVSLLAQSDVDEAHEQHTAGRGRSSTMPHKRNPVACAAILATSLRVPPLVATVLAAMTQEHERALGGWQSEWETIPEIVVLTVNALSRAVDVLGNLDVDVDRMAANIDATRGVVFTESLMFALARVAGRETASALVNAALERARADDAHLRDVVLADPAIVAVLEPSELEKVFDPRAQLANAESMARDAAAAIREDAALMFFTDTGD